MARARNIKPGFFTNEHLGELEPLARLLFIGLWCQADREGRLEDRPKRLKIDILPYDDCDIEFLLETLADSPDKFIQRYSVDGKKYIAITNFTKHQNPHAKEQVSTIPTPIIIEEAPDETGAKTMQAPDETGAKTMQAPDETGTCPADSLLLIPDSLLLIPDSLLLIPDSLKLSNDNSSPEGDKQCPHQDILKLFNSVCVSLPRITQMTEPRQDTMRVWWRKSKLNLDMLREFFERVEKSDFLSNRQGNFTSCSFDWIIREKNRQKILEGNYDNKNKKSEDWRGFSAG